MGAGAKSDPSRIQIGDISDTYEDPLSRSCRRILKRLGCDSKVPVVYSTERPGNVKLLPLPDSNIEESDQYSTLPTFRSRILPVLGPIPALFGTAMASFVVTEIAGVLTEPLVVKNTRKVVEKCFSDLIHSERKHLGQEYFKLMLVVKYYLVWLMSILFFKMYGIHVALFLKVLG
jgi:hypothetical protein